MYNAASALVVPTDSLSAVTWEPHLAFPQRFGPYRFCAQNVIGTYLTYTVSGRCLSLGRREGAEAESRVDERFGPGPR